MAINIHDPVQRRLAGLPLEWTFGVGVLYDTPWSALYDTTTSTISMCVQGVRIASMDMTKTLRYFARMQAVSCLDAWTQEPPQVVLDWLMTGEEKYRGAARAAAYNAAQAATWDAARATAQAAARAAAYNAALDAARDAARATARDDFAALVYECFECVVNSDGTHRGHSSSL